MLSGNLTINPLAAQPDPGVAKEHFKNRNYFMAVEHYERLLRYEPKNVKYLHDIGVCHLRLNQNKTKAIKYLEKCVSLPKYDVEAVYDLGVGYTHALNYDEARKTFERYKTEVAGKEELVAKADHALANCDEAQKLMLQPIDVSFENMGDHINTPLPDYYPYSSKDGSILFFTSRREENKGNAVEFDGYYPSDGWMVINTESGWGKPINMTTINTRYDEQVVGCNSDGSMVYVYVDQLTTADGHIFGDIYTSQQKKGKFARKEKMNENVNSKHFESSACVSEDGNTLFFASDRPEGYGGLDLWMAKKLPNGEWAIPMNLGPDINTNLDEDFPSLSADGLTIYFASKGHPGMGGFDLFKVKWDPEYGTFETPKNIGYPLNTPADDMTIAFTSDSTTAFVTALRPEGLGDLDIYKVTFNEVEVKSAVFVLQLLTGDTSNPVSKDAFVMVFDDMGEEVGSYTANQSSGNVVMALSTGMYSVEIEAEGYDMKIVDLKVTDFHVRMGEIKKNISLAP